MANEILAVGTGAATSADVVVAQGAQLTVALKGSSTPSVAGCIAHIQLKDEAGTFWEVSILDGDSQQAMTIIGSGTYRFRRPASSAACGVFSTAPYVFSDSDAAALAAAMNVEPSDEHKALIDDFFLSIKQSTAWAKIDFLQIYRAHDSQAATLNWKNPSAVQATLVNSPTFNAFSNIVTNGVDQEIDTGYNPATFGGSYTQSSACIGYWSTKTGTNTSSVVGWIDGTQGATMNPRDASNRMGFNVNQLVANASSGSNGSVTDGSGLFAGNRSGASALQSYRNGAAIAIANNPTSASVAIVNGVWRVGRISTAGFRVAEAGLLFGSSSLTATEHAEVYAALQPYMAGVAALP